MTQGAAETRDRCKRNRFRGAKPFSRRPEIYYFPSEVNWLPVANMFAEFGCGTISHSYDPPRETAAQTPRSARITCGDIPRAGGIRLVNHREQFRYPSSTSDSGTHQKAEQEAHRRSNNDEENAAELELSVARGEQASSWNVSEHLENRSQSLPQLLQLPSTLSRRSSHHGDLETSGILVYIFRPGTSEAPTEIS